MSGTAIEIEERLKRGFPKKQASVLAEVLADVRASAGRDLVKASDFGELKAIVKELAQAQKRTEQRVEELAQAQKRTEQRVEELAQAQKRTEQRVEELAQAQKRTEERVEELVRALRDTQEEIRKLVVGLAHTRTDLGGLQRSFGYMLENEAYRRLPSVMKEKFGVEVRERFLRKFLTLSDGTEVEVNVLGKGVRDGEEVPIVGEAKSILEGKDVDRFLEILEGLKASIGRKVFKLFITHSARPSVEKYALENGIQVVYTYEF